MHKNTLESHLSIVFDLDDGSTLIFVDQCLWCSILELHHQSEVAVDVVVREYITAGSREGQMAAVEGKDVLTIDHHAPDWKGIAPLA